MTSTSKKRGRGVDGYAVTLSEHVRWGDMDAFEHLNNTAYFRLFECVRMHYFKRIGWITRGITQETAPILAHTECYFKQPLTYPDKVIVCAHVRDLAEDRFTMDYAIFNEKDHDRPAATGSGFIVCFDYKNKQRTALPLAITENIHQLQASGN